MRDWQLEVVVVVVVVLCSFGMEDEEEPPCLDSVRELKPSSVTFGFGTFRQKQHLYRMLSCKRYCHGERNVEGDDDDDDPPQAHETDRGAAAAASYITDHHCCCS